MQHSTQFRAMNTDIEVLVETPGPMPPLDVFIGAKLLFEEQEQRFSRFRPQSLLSRLRLGEEVEDAMLARVCRMAIEAWEFTGGWFNPMVLPALLRAGYDRSFELLQAGGVVEHAPVASPKEALVLAGDRVRLAAGGLDLGGIVKGLTVDSLIESYSGSYEGMFVNAAATFAALAMRVSYGWQASIDGAGVAATPEGVMHGALATSTSTKRRWRTAAGTLAHHLIDPATGMPAASPFVQASVWAAECWRAETWAKAVVIGGTAALEMCQASGLAVLALEADGIARRAPVVRGR